MKYAWRVPLCATGERRHLSSTSTRREAHRLPSPAGEEERPRRDYWDVERTGSIYRIRVSDWQIGTLPGRALAREHLGMCLAARGAGGGRRMHVDRGQAPSPRPFRPDFFSFRAHRWLAAVGSASEGLERWQVVAAGALAILTVGVADALTGPLMSLTLFYLVPVAAVAWLKGRGPASLLALLASSTWAFADQLGPRAEPKAPIAYWNDLTLLGVFLLIVGLVVSLRNGWDWENHLLAEVQRSLLPESFAAVAGCSVECRWLPAGIVAGDYYDVLPLDEQRVGLCIADVSGKGMPAALIMSNVQATVRALASQHLAPQALVGQLNRLLCPNLRPGSFVTLIYAVFAAESGDLRYVNAGHNPALLVRASGSVERLDPTGPVLGIFPDARYECRRAALQAGDHFVLFTDGLTERARPSGEELGEKRLAELVVACRSKPARQICDAILREVTAFGSGPFEDDLTLMIVSPRR